MEIKNIKIAELNPAEYNPREISEFEIEELKKSITEFGLVEPVVVNQDMTIIGGHQRVRACQELEMTEVPCFVVDLDKKREKLLNITLNRVQGRWDEEKLSTLIYELKNDAEVEAIIGFREAEIDQYILRKQVQLEDKEEYDPDKDEELQKLFDLHEKVPVSVEKPDARKNAQRLSFYTENMEEYNKIREFFQSTRKGELNKDKLLSFIE